jgi:hypothetical protein
MNSLSLVSLIFLFVCFSFSFAYSKYNIGVGKRLRLVPSIAMAAEGESPAVRKVFNVQIPLGEGYKPVVTKFRPLFENSQLFITSYPVPFSLNVEPSKDSFKLPIVTKDGSRGEKIGDILRATTCWTKGEIFTNIESN